MNRTRRGGPRTGMAAVLGLLATAALHLPPYDAAQRSDRLLLDAYSRLAMPAAPDDILIVDLDAPAALESIAGIAARERAALLVTTLPQPPTPDAHTYALGPSQLPLGSQLLQPTGWSRGGHLWQPPDIDGVIRHDVGRLAGRQRLNSLAHAVAGHREAAEIDTPDAGEQRHWLRFFDPGTFRRIDAAALAASPALAEGRTLVAGTGATRHATPIGRLTGHELLAQAIASYRRGHVTAAGPVPRVLLWLAAATVLAMLFARPGRGPVVAVTVLGSGAVALTATGFAAFAGTGLWLPVAGPVLWLAATGMVLGLGALAHAAGWAAGDGASSAGAFAIRADRGTAPSRLDDLYTLATQLEAQAQPARAAELYLRIAQVDPFFRDTTRRLVAVTRTGDPAPAADAPTLPQLPESLGRYRLLELIGHGAAGHVFLGLDPSIHRLVAIKVVDLGADLERPDFDEAAERFRREAEAAGRLNHPGIMTVHDVGDAAGLAYIAMEYLRGRRLSEFATAGRLLEPARVLELIARAADALAYAHGQDVIHRDIKPANIMYDSVLDTLKITDFGTATLTDISRTRTGIVLGTPSYMAPEQVEGRNVNGHTDLFALGVSLYQLLTGLLPFRGNSMTDLMFSIAHEPHDAATAVRADLPAAIDTVIDRALAKDPGARFASGAAMADALRTVAARIG